MRGLITVVDTRDTGIERMSALKRLAARDGWVAVNDSSETGKTVIGTHDGDPIRVGVNKTNAEESPWSVYQSGPYTVEVRTGPREGQKEVRVTRESFDREHETRLVDGGGNTHELTLPVQLVEEVGWGDRGREVDVQIEWFDEGLRTLVKPEEGEGTSRRIQHRESRGNTQYYIYYPRAVVAAFGLTNAIFEWETEAGYLVAEITRVRIGNQSMAYRDVSTSGVTGAPASYRGAASKSTARVRLPIRLQGAGGQPSLLLSAERAFHLGFDTTTAGEVMILCEWTPSGPAYVIHDRPDELATDSRDRGVKTTTQVDEENRVKVYLPKDLVSALQAKTVCDWWPVKDRYYGTGGRMLVGLPVDHGD